MLEVLDAPALRSWCTASRVALGSARQGLDDLNVFPVPDGDTGTNLLLTAEAVDDAVRAAPGDLAATARAMATGALVGARGNSGVIMSQLLRGLAEVLGPTPGDGAALARALDRATELAYAAVATPVEGTVLTVARGAADAALAVGAPAGLAAVTGAALQGARAALARTPDLLEALRVAGVVDAGGRGLCVVLEALDAVVTGRAVPLPELHVRRDRTALMVAREAGSDAYAYEVQYLLHDATDDAVAVLRGALASLGDSLVVAGGQGLHSVHVHVDDVGAAVEAGVAAGRPSRITVTRFADQVGAGASGSTDMRGVTDDDDLPVMNERPAVRAVVAVASGAGIIRLFSAAGALVVDGGPGACPSTAQLLAAVRRTGAAEVVLLPNDGDVRAVADAAAGQAREQGTAVTVVPTRSCVQGLAALAVADPALALPADAAAMSAAAGATRWAEVVHAVRDARTAAGPCRAGDVLGLSAGAVITVGDDVVGVAQGLLDELLQSAELLTLVTGAAATQGLGERLTAYARARRPGLDVTLVDGGQPHAVLLLGAE